MSYILDALKKSDQQRQRGATPTLATAQTMWVEARPSPALYYGLAASALLASVLAVGLLHAWHPAGGREAPDDRIVASAPRSAMPAPRLGPPAPPAAAETPAPPVRAKDYFRPVLPPSMEAARALARKPSPTREAVPQAAKKAETAPAPAPASGGQDKSAVVEKQGKPAAEENKIMAIADLPPAIRKQVPQMEISAYLYSRDPQGRMVGINERLLREGDYVAPGIKLEEIRSDGLVFGLKGYRFHHDPQ